MLVLTIAVKLSEEEKLRKQKQPYCECDFYISKFGLIPILEEKATRKD